VVPGVSKSTLIAAEYMEVYKEELIWVAACSPYRKVSMHAPQCNIFWKILVHLSTAQRY
jgi:hypothetical protein